MQDHADQNRREKYRGSGCKQPEGNKRRQGEITRKPPAKAKQHAILSIRRGDRVRLVTPGGGGNGDPSLRDPEAIARDMREGYISAEAGRREYGHEEERG